MVFPPLVPLALLMFDAVMLDAGEEFPFAAVRNSHVFYSVRKPDSANVPRHIYKCKGAVFYAGASHRAKVCVVVCRTGNRAVASVKNIVVVDRTVKPGANAAVFTVFPLLHSVRGGVGVKADVSSRRGRV